MHAQVTMAEAEPEQAISNVSYSAPADPSETGGSMQAAAAIHAAEMGEEPPLLADEPTQAPVVLSEWDKTPRNAPCPCGSGKKFKLCHGQ